MNGSDDIFAGRRRLLMGAVAAGVLGLTGLPVRARTRGGTLTAALGEARATDSWDARTHAGIFMIASAQGAVFDTLTEVAADGSLRGELAERWDSADARTWVFDLRRGVTFHDGSPFGPRDVVASLRLHLTGPSIARPIVDGIADMAITGPHQVTFTLDAPNADFPYLMSDYHLLIYPADRMEQAMADGIGTGLYRVEHFQPGVGMAAVRVPGHYKGDGVGSFDRIEFLALNDPAARLRALAEGRVDAISAIDPHDVAHTRSLPGVTVQDVAGNHHLAFSMRADRAPCDHIHVRKALKYGLDRQALVDHVLCGHGQVGQDTPIGPANQFFADLGPMPFDPDRARYHLAQAGLSDLRVSLSATSHGFAGAELAGQMVRDTTAQAGIDVRLTGPSGHLTAVNWSGRATEDWMLRAALAQNGASDAVGADFHDLLRAGRSELDSDRRRTIYAQIQAILRDRGGMLVPMFAHFLQAHGNGLGAPDTIGNLWPMDNARMAERWWRV